MELLNGVTAQENKLNSLLCGTRIHSYCRVEKYDINGLRILKREYKNASKKFTQVLHGWCV